MDMRETRISGEYFFEGRIMKARVDEVRLPNGKQASREVCEHVGGVGVLPIDQDGNIILVRQFRYPFDTETLEMPAGKMDHGPENAEECGVRELAEETGCTAGRIVRVQNAQNEDIVPDTQQYIPAKDGNSLVLTIDSDIQNYLEKHLETAFADNPEARDGVSGIVMNIKTGEVLAMASYPTYSLADYNSTAAAEDRANDSRHPEVNRVTSGVYPPGSTFKVLSAIAGLEEGIIDANTQITCTGVFEYGGQKFTCKNHDTPMTLDVTGALKYSCNTFFYTVGQKLTGEHLEKWSERFGLGVVTGIGIIVAYNRSRKRTGASPICGKFGSLAFQILVIAFSLLSSVGAVLPVN